MAGEYGTTEPTRKEVDAMQGPTLLEFGSPWIADARSRRLGRSFRVKLWPTLVFLVRPGSADEIRRALGQIGLPAPG